MARYGVVVVSVDYRLSRPGAPTWPGNLDDVREAVRWVRHHADDYGVDPERIAVIGSSAGAHLALMLAFDASHSPGGDRSSRVAAVVDLYGPTDLRALRASRAATGEPVTLMVGGRPEDMPERYDAASPLLHVTPKVPPVLIIHGDEDALVPLEQSVALDAKLTESGVPHKLMVVPGARHGFELRVGASPRAPALDLAPTIFAFLEGVWSGKSTK
jgi:acetyl esterase/lipase